MNLQYDDLILGSLIGGDKDAYKRAAATILPEHLVGTHRQIYEVAQRYFKMTGAPIDWSMFGDVVTRSDLTADRRLALTQEFQRLWYAEVPDAHFRYALHAIRELRRDEALTSGLSEALRTMLGETGKDQGYDAAREKLTKALAEIDRTYQPDSPEGDIRDDFAEVLRKYEDSKTTGGYDSRMVRTGMTEVDRRIVGLRPGENMLVAGYSAHGKTTLLQNIAWGVCVLQAKNVLVMTNENQYAAYRDRIYDRHSHHLPGEVGVLGGLRHGDIKTGQLSGADELVWARVCNDFGTNPAYGKLEVVQMPTGASVEWAVNQMERFGDEFPVDLVILDYIGRCGPIVPREKRRDELNDSIMLWKSALVGYQRGYGVPGITGYQTSRDAAARAQINGYYDLSCLAETSEAERNADHVLSVLRQEEIENEVRLQLLKNRDGALMEPTTFAAAFATTLIASQNTGGWM